MKRCFESLSKSGPALIFGLIVWLSASGLALTQSPAQQAVPVLEGLDPVLLIQGQEVQGKDKISVTRGRFQYLFANEENKALFEKDPRRYEIQLDGTCARMGPTSLGKPDLYLVYQDRLYLFASPNCLKAFKAAPEKYLEPDEDSSPKMTITVEAAKKGQALIAKAVEAIGGASKLDAMTSYQSKGVSVNQMGQRTMEIKTGQIILYPDRVRDEQAIASMGTAARVQLPGEAFMSFSQSNGRIGLQILPEAYRAELGKQRKRDPLVILRSRTSAGFKAASIGSDNADETPVEQVRVELDGVSTTLSIDPTTGRILRLSYRGRHSTNFVIGEVLQTFSDFRTVDGLTLPFKVIGICNGTPDPERTFNLESITINGKIDPALFEKPQATKQ